MLQRFLKRGVLAQCQLCKQGAFSQSFFLAITYRGTPDLLIMHNEVDLLISDFHTLCRRSNAS